jgi:hypothetical protein
MKYFYTLSEFNASTNDQVNKILPQNFSVEDEDDTQVLLVETNEDDDALVFVEVQQECDRVFFLTGIDLNPTLVRKEIQEGQIEIRSSQGTYLIGSKPIDPNIDRQEWTIPLSVQLRLWKLANQPDLPVAVKINLLFQIIECSYPDRRNQSDYPRYNRSDAPPHPRTEAKLMRDLASHGFSDVASDQLRNYCKYIKIPAKLHNPTDPKFIRKLQDKLSIVRNQAQELIDNAITRNH